jgi:hypothetical protein
MISADQPASCSGKFSKHSAFKVHLHFKRIDQIRNDIRFPFKLNINTAPSLLDRDFEPPE